MQNVNFDITATGTDILAAVAGTRFIIHGFLLWAHAAETISLQDTDAAELVGPILTVSGSQYGGMPNSENQLPSPALSKGVQLAKTGAGRMAGILFYTAIKITNLP